MAFMSNRGRTWLPKKKVLCDKCGWKGVRGLIHKKCPRCGNYYPKEITR